MTRAMRWLALLGVCFAFVSGNAAAAGSWLLADEFSEEVAQYGPDGAQFANFVDNVGAPFGSLDQPSSIAQGPDGRVYVTSSGGAVVRYSSTGDFLDIFNSGSYQSGSPRASGVAFFADGDVLMAGLSGMRRLSPAGTLLQTFATTPVYYPQVAANGDILAVTASGLQRFDGSTGALLATLDTGSFSGTLIGPDGNLYVSKGEDIVRYDGLTNAPLGVFASLGLGSQPQGMEFGPDGALYVVDFNDGNADRFDGTTGDFLGEFLPVGTMGLGRDIAWITPVPEPASVVLLGVGLAGVALVCRNRRRQLPTGVQACGDNGRA
jgi:glucose/arabinose dehydrogenase